MFFLEMEILCMDIGVGIKINYLWKDGLQVHMPHPQIQTGIYIQLHEIRQVQEYAETLKVEMRKISAEADITFETISNSAPLATDKDAAITYLGTSLTRNNMLGRVSFATDAGWLNRAGIPCVVIGPGDIDVAHKPNEFIEISQLEECLGFMDRLRERMTQEVLLA